MLSGNVLDMMCLMRGSTLPALLAEAIPVGSVPDSRRDKAEKIHVKYVRPNTLAMAHRLTGTNHLSYSNFQLDTSDRFGSFPVGGKDLDCLIWRWNC